jgi:hypothetical protein
MKRITLIVRQTELNKIFAEGLQLLLEDNSNIIDAVRQFDEEIKKRTQEFPIKKRKSLLPMVFHPHEERFYKQVTMQAYTDSDQFLNIRTNVKMPLPDNATIILVPEGGCTTDWEEPVE